MELTLKEAISTVEAYGLLDVDIPKPYKRAIQVLYDHAKKSMEPLEGEELVGRNVRIIKRLHGHEFEIGDVVEIIKFYHGDNDCLDFSGRKGASTWYLSQSEFEVIE